MKNKLIRLLIALFAKKKSSPPTDSAQRRFLIVTTTGLGDTIWALPAIRALRQSFPSSYIAVLTSEVGEQVLENNPYVDDLFDLTDNSLLSFFSFFLILRKKKIDTILLFHASQRLTFLLCGLLGAPQVFGTAGINKGLDDILTHPLQKKPQHEIERRLDIVIKAGAAVEDPSLYFHFSRADEQQAKKFLDGFGLSKESVLIGLHPGAKNVYKQWDPKYFVEVGRKLSETLDCHIVVSGDREEALLVFEVASHIPGAIPIAGELTVGAFAAVIKKMALMISNDTGPMHLSVANKTPTIALFCPTDPRICGPYHAAHAVVIEKPKTCTPCLAKKCLDPFCLLQISPNEVYEKALELFYAKDREYESLEKV